MRNKASILPLVFSLVLILGLSLISRHHLASAQVTPRPANTTVLRFDGKDDYIKFTQATFGNIDFSFEAWVRTSQTTSYVIGMNDATDMRIVNGHAYFDYASSTGFRNLEGTKTINDSQWHHVLMVRQGFTNVLYVDGVVDGTMTTTGTVNTGFLAIGQRGSNANFFKGSLSEVRIYKRALSASEAASHFTTSQTTPGSPDPDLLAAWHFNEGTGTTVADYSGNNHTGTLMNGAAWTPRDLPSPRDFYVSPTGAATNDGSQNSPWDLATALDQPVTFNPGDTLRLRGGTYQGQFTAHLTGTAASHIIVEPFAGESPKIDGSLYIGGSDTWYQGFEIMDSEPNRISGEVGSAPTDIPQRAGVNIHAPRTKFINMVVHDGGNGIGFWEDAPDSEVYGNVIYNNGWMGPDRPHGHGIYTQNYTGTKNITDNIDFAPFYLSMQIYGSSASHLVGYNVDGNTFFGSGTIVGGNAPADQMNFSNNYLYNSSLQFGYGSPDNQSASLKNNYIYTQIPINIQWWKNFVITGNTFIAKSDSSGGNGSIALATGGDLSGFTIDNNTHYRGRTGTFQNFFVRNPDNSLNFYTFAQWQASLGFDTHSTFVSDPNINKAALPTGAKVFVRPNKYETGRANITIFNWDKAATVAADISNIGLKPGDSYIVHDGQNYLGAPVLTGTYNGSPITLPMDLGTTIPPRLGTVVNTYPYCSAYGCNVANSTPAHTSPEFNVFVIQKMSNFATISVTKTVDSPNAAPGDILTYSLTVKNSGGVPATQAILADPIPVGSTFISASDNGTVTNNTVSWSLPTIPANGELTRTLVLHAQ